MDFLKSDIKKYYIILLFNQYFKLLSNPLLLIGNLLCHCLLACICAYDGNLHSLIMFFDCNNLWSEMLVMCTNGSHFVSGAKFRSIV